MIHPRFAAVALAALLSAPLAASAQTAPAPAPPPPASAAPGAHHHHHHHSRYMRALRKLNLSDAQKQQIAGFMKSTRTANQNADPATRKANVKQMRQQIEGVLTPDQQAQLHAGLTQKQAAPAPQ